MIFKEVLFLFQKLKSSKYIISGKCHQCGKCCKEIIFKNGDKYITTEEQFNAMKNFDKTYRNFDIAGKNEDGVLLFRCKALSDDNKCLNYYFRSLPCRMYPNPDKKFLLGGGTLLEGCGYKIVKTKNFKDFLANEKIK